MSIVADVIEDFESLQSISRILGAEIVSPSAADHVVKIEITTHLRLRDSLWNPSAEPFLGIALARETAPPWELKRMPRWPCQLAVTVKRHPTTQVQAIGLAIRCHLPENVSQSR